MRSYSCPKKAFIFNYHDTRSDIDRSSERALRFSENFRLVAEEKFLAVLVRFGQLHNTQSL